MDGVIQIFTHRGTTRIPEFTAFADGGNFATGHGGAELSGLLGRFDYSAGVSDLETAGQGPNDAFRNRTLSGNFGWRFSDTARISLSLRDNDSEAGTPGQTLLQPANLTDTIALQDFNAGLHADFATGSHWHHQLSGTETLFPRIQFRSVFLRRSYQYNRAGFAGQSTYLLRGFAVTAGYEYEVENGFLSTRRCGHAADSARRNNQAGFLDVALAAGRAADAERRGARRRQRRFRHACRCRARARPMPCGWHRARSATRACTHPMGRESWSPDSINPSAPIPAFPGNPNLSPEQSRTIHAGVEQKLASDRVRVTADYFDSRFHNIVSFLNVAPSAGVSRGRRSVWRGHLFQYGSGARARRKFFRRSAHHALAQRQRKLHVRFHAHALRAHRSR